MKLLIEILVVLCGFLLIAGPTIIIPAVLDRRRRHRRGNLFANIAEGTREFDSLVPDVNVPARHLITKRGSDTLHFALPTAAADKPFGVCEDQSSQGGVPLPGLPFRVSLLGVSPRTKKVAVNSTVAVDDDLVSVGDGTGYAKTLPTTVGAGVFWVIGRAQTAASATGVAGTPAIVEFIAQVPYKITL